MVMHDPPRETRINGNYAKLVTAMKDYTCNRCYTTIAKGEKHYCVYYGIGLGSLKFPDRIHVKCVHRLREKGERCKR